MIHVKREKGNQHRAGNP